MGNSSNSSTCCDGALGENISWAVTYALLAVAGSSGNLLVIYLVYSVRKLRSASNAFIVNVCAADLLVCGLWMPQEAVALALSRPPRAAAGPASWRSLAAALLLLALLASLFSHSLIALNRYALITKAPAAYRDLYRRRNAAAMIASSWLAAAVLLLLPWLMAAALGRPRPGACLLYPGLAAASSRGGCSCSLTLCPYAAAVTAASILAHTAVLLYAYYKILRRVQVSVNRVSVLNFHGNNLSYPCARKDKKLRLYVSFVLSAFLLSTEPLVWVLLCGLVEPVPALLCNLAWLPFALLFVLSPYVYTCKNQEFRKSLRTVLGIDLSRAEVEAEPAIYAVSR